MDTIFLAANYTLRLTTIEHDL